VVIDYLTQRFNFFFVGLMACMFNQLLSKLVEMVLFLLGIHSCALMDLVAGVYQSVNFNSRPFRPLKGKPKPIAGVSFSRIVNQQIGIARYFRQNKFFRL
jgi:hypothetical protein